MNQLPTEDLIEAINQRVEWGMKKLRTVRRLAGKGGPVPDYHFDELREIVNSLRHHTEKLNEE